MHVFTLSRPSTVKIQETTTRLCHVVEVTRIISFFYTSKAYFLFESCDISNTLTFENIIKILLSTVKILYNFLLMQHALIISRMILIDIKRKLFQTQQVKYISLKIKFLDKLSGFSSGLIFDRIICLFPSIMTE